MNTEQNIIKIYYAHGKRDYATRKEKDEIRAIQIQFPTSEIINPGQIKEKKESEYAKIAGKCDLIIASEYQNYIGKGVFAEIARAFSKDIPIQVIRGMNDSFTFTQVTGIKIINEHDWNRYGKIIIDYS